MVTENSSGVQWKFEAVIITDQYRSTPEILTREALIDFLGDECLRDTIQTCAGEWRIEPDGKGWRFWLHPSENE